MTPEASADREKGFVSAPIAFRLLGVAAGAAALLLIVWLVCFAWADLRCARAAIAYPFEIDYGEGIVWQQALLIPGPRMYGPIDRLPFIVFHYPPVYHLTSRAVMALGVDPLVAGRMVSVAATVVIVMCVAWLVAAGLEGRAKRSAMLVGAVTGALLPLSLSPIESWFVRMRVDMLAIALAFLGVAFAVRAERRPAWLEWLTAGGFLRHIIWYNVNTWSFALLRERLQSHALYAVLLAVAVAGLGLSWPRRGAITRREDSEEKEYTGVVPTLGLWLLLSLVMLPTVGKTGSSVNYFIELMCVCAVATGMLVGLCWEALTNANDAAFRIGLLCVAIALLAMLAKRRHYCADYFDPGLIAIQENLVRELAREPKPVMSEDMILLLRAGKEVPIEPAIFRELAMNGQWDQRRYLDLIDNHAFAFMITKPDKILTPERYTPEMLAATARAYPRVEVRGPYLVHYPAPQGEPRRILEQSVNSRPL